MTPLDLTKCRSAISAHLCIQLLDAYVSVKVVDSHQFVVIDPQHLEVD